MLISKRTRLIENRYEIQNEAKHASIFGIGNGYFGIRGSFEEFGDVFVQGTYIRGVFDQIVEIPQTFSDNEYMKNYYFDGQKLKQFELEDSCINVCDFTLIRFFIGDQLFLPWVGKIVKWKRYIDYSTGALIRKVLWDDGKGNLTEFYFERCCSFANHHLFYQKATAKRINHHLPITILSGVDTLVKTNGQHKSQVIDAWNQEGEQHFKFYFGDKYHMEAALVAQSHFQNVKNISQEEKDGVYATKAEADGDFVEVDKIVDMHASCDYKEKVDLLSICINDMKDVHFASVKAQHLKSYKAWMSLIDIKLDNDAALDGYLRYANYQTLIGIDRFDEVHSLSAKNLTAEKYNQFVWWDCEILQLPIFLATMPKAAKSVLMYRYRCLNKAKENAKQNGYDGAQFAFCSSVLGDENVWIYARHPFLQIHITSDVGYGIINYYRHTLDQQFLKDYGLEMLMEISKYFASRMTYQDGKYHIRNVTGTDEHHPYIDNNAYTNYEVHFVISKTLEYAKKLDYKLDETLQAKLEDIVQNMVLPMSKNGIIPQFDGYLNLKPYLPLVGNGAAKGFQMKQSGLYHQSQIIKQPDVMNLYAYLNIDLESNYRKNWRLYEKRCESSSSLTYPVHAICAVDNEEYDKFKKYFLEAIKIDIDDLHHCAYQGVHAGCIAGGWYMIYRGICGLKAYEDYLQVHPHFVEGMDRLKFQFYYHGIKVKVEMSKEECKIISSKREPFPLKIYGKIMTHQGVTIIKNKKYS